MKTKLGGRKDLGPCNRANTFSVANMLIKVPNLHNLCKYWCIGMMVLVVALSQERCDVLKCYMVESIVYSCRFAYYILGQIVTNLVCDLHNLCEDLHEKSLKHC